MNVKEIATALKWLTEKPLVHYVRINNINYYIDFMGNFCIKGTREIAEGKEDIYLNTGSDVLFSEIMDTKRLEYSTEEG